MISLEEVKAILEKVKTIAVVGLSDSPLRTSHDVARYLQQQGYRIIPVNPNVDEVLGEKSYPDLKSIDTPVDAVQIFRRSEEVPPHVDEAMAIGASVIWMQEGVVHEGAAERARSAGIEVVMDLCMRAAHQYLGEIGML